jgi:MYXO-CTERM domain-containing protein
MKTLFRSFLLIAAVACGGVARGEVLLRIEGGLLVGASGVSVNGALYDVSFGDGSCNSLQLGCTSFAFSAAGDAAAAAQALLDQVFLGIYDSSPDLTLGCTSTRQCLVSTIFGPESLGNNLASTANRPIDAADAVTSGLIGNAFNTAGNIDVTLAVWTRQPPPGQVSEPTSLMLALASLGALAWRRRRRRSGSGAARA